MKKETKVVIILMAVVVALVVLLRATGYWKSDFDRPADQKPNYAPLRAELAKVEKGDFVEFAGRLYAVTGTNHANNGGMDKIVGVGHGDAAGTPIDYGYDEVLAKIGRIVRWNEGSDQMTTTPIGHLRWTATAREFFGVR